METPSSTSRRVTRSQTLSALKNSLLPSSSKEETVKCETKSRQRIKQQEQRSALFDITNDSPIVGLATGKTPSSGMKGKRKVSRITPGSGEALLRGQVKNLLHKVEEEADLTKLSLHSRPFIHLLTSPMGLLAPTPANTPQVADLSDQFKVVITSPVVAGPASSSSQVGKEESLELEKSPSINRSLLLDFSSDCSSVVTQNTEDDNSSVWSMQVNTSTKDDEDDDDEVFSYSHIEDEEEYYEEQGEIVDGLCEGMRKMNFAGKHTRFVYDSEDEEIVEAREQSLGVLRLKGLPTPKGKHVRFDS